MEEMGVEWLQRTGSDGVDMTQCDVEPSQYTMFRLSCLLLNCTHLSD